MPRNVIQVVVDQQIAGCAGYEGHPQAITPHLDRLAAEGTWFRHAYTANPICTPTRVSMLSGRYCCNHRCFGLAGPTPTDLPSFLGHFRAHGYATAAVGKLHLPDDPVDWARDHCDLYANVMNRAPDSRPLYDALREAGYDDEFDACSLSEFPGTGNNAVEARPSRLPFELSAEGYANRLAGGFIDGAAAAGKPFCIQVSYHRPHQCYTPHRRFWELYDGDLELPPGALEDLNPDRPPHFLRAARGHRNLPGDFEPTDPVSRMKRVWRGYLACITHCDHALGELLDHLEARGVLDDTIVVFHADHGAYSGAFGINEKAPGICSELVCRIPFLWRLPDTVAAGRRCDALAHVVDLAPTLSALCGLPAMPGLDGVDLTPLLRGGGEPVRREAVTECAWSRSLRFDRWRYVHYPEGMFAGYDHGGDFAGELYDLESDPWETRNLARDAKHAAVLHEARRRLLDWLSQTLQPTTVLPKVGGNRGPVTRHDLETHVRAGKVQYL